MRGLALGLCLSIVLVASVASGLSFSVVYEDQANGAGVGFDDPLLGALRRGTLEAALGVVSSNIQMPGSIDIGILASEVDGAGFLARAGPYYFVDFPGYQNGFAYIHAALALDPAPDLPDAEVQFDFGYSWNSELDQPAEFEFDLMSVALHEITHTLGFLSVLQEDGQSALGENTYGFYDSFLQRGDGSWLFDAEGYFLGSAADLVSNDIFFAGANASAANGGSPVQIFAPSTFYPGSSLSHLNDPGAVTSYSVGPGDIRRSFSAIELGVLEDLGWNVVPEPTEGILLGLGLAGLASTRRR